jgi:uncharacterized membrane protein
LLENLIMSLGYGLCHQLPERSYTAGGVQAPVCVRDTGIYVGTVVALALIVSLHRGERPLGFPSARVWAAMGVFFIALGIDGVTSYAGLRTTTNEIRLLTGLGLGFSIAAILVPMLNDELWRRADQIRVLDTNWRFLAWLLGVPVSFVVIHYGGPQLGVGFPLLITLCIIATLAAVNLVIVAMLPWFDRAGTDARSLLAPLALAVLVAFIEIGLSAGFRLILVELVARYT